jgi:hypothetical protein
MFSQATLVIFTPSLSIIAGRIAREIVPDLPDGACHIYTTVDMFRSGLQLRDRENCVVILLAADQRELDAMLAMTPLLDGMPLILMVPDSDPVTIAKAHRLRPRYLMFPRTGFEDLRAVMEKIFTRRGARFRHMDKAPAHPASTPLTGA